MLELDDHEDMPGATVLVATTLALMTTWVDPAPQPDGTPGRHRTHLARKIVANLFMLQQHPEVDPQLSRVLGTLHQRWVAIARGAMQQQGMDVSALTCCAGTLH